VKAAVRHLLRNRRRSLLTLIAVIVPVFILVLMYGMVAGEMRGFFDGAVELQTGHFQIRATADRPAGGALPLIDDPEPLVALIEATSGIERFTVRLDVPALAAAGDHSQGIVVQGIAEPQSGKGSPLADLVTDGRYLAGDGRSAVVGEDLARLLDLEVGDPLVLLGAHPDAGLGVAKPTIVGIFSAPDETLSRSVVEVDLAVAERLVRQSGAATAIVGYVQGIDGPWDAERIDRVVVSLKARIPDGYEILDWRELSPDLGMYMRLARPIMTLFSGIFFVLGGLVVLNTLYLSVLERTRELGIIIALGASRRRVMWMIQVEAGLVAVTGGTIGALGGAALVWLVEAVGGLRLPGAYTGFLEAFGMQPLLHLRVTIPEIALSAAAMVIVALLAAWYPAFRASRLEPMEAMRYVE
jgi:ABC-type lipoprotein release transport system permease subunit